MNFVRKYILLNWELKIASLLIAIFLWFVSNEEQSEQIIELPLEFKNLPSSIICLTDLTNRTVEVKVKGGRKEIWKIKVMQAKSIVDLSNAHKGSMRYAIGRGNIVIPTSANVQLIDVITPQNIDIEFDNLITKTVPVKLIIEGHPPNNYVLIGEPNITPDEVTLKGAEEILKSVEFLKTETVSLKNSTESFIRNIPLDLSGLINVTPNIKEVRVGVRIEKLLVKSFSNIKIDVKYDIANFDATVRPDTIQAVLTAPESYFSNFSSEDIVVSIDLNNKKQGIYYLTPNVKVPKGVSKVIIEPKLVRIELIEAKKDTL